MNFKTLLRAALACIAILVSLSVAKAEEPKSNLIAIEYNNPAIKSVDLGVGLWGFPIPMDADGDGDIDLLISCPDKPYNGVYFFENPGAADGPSRTGSKDPIFKPAVRLGPGEKNVLPSYVDGKVRILMPGKEPKKETDKKADKKPVEKFCEKYLKKPAKKPAKETKKEESKAVLTEVLDFAKSGLEKTIDLPVKANVHENKVRANHWRYVDYDGDGNLDLISGIGDWTEYGWDNAYDRDGNWTRGPLRGYVYLLRNKGTSDKPAYEEPKKLTFVDAAGAEQPIDVYGMPSPNFADFDRDGDLDLLCGEFVDTLTYFENIGTRTKPKFAAGRKITQNGKPLKINLCMFIAVAFDWNKDGNMDLVICEEDGRVVLLEHSGKLTADRCPSFKPQRYFQQQPEEIKFGALVTPYGVDFDADGDDDLVCGNTAGNIGWFENLGISKGNTTPTFAPVKLLESDGRPIQIMAGPNGSIQGPCETKWGYTTQTVADWDNDGLPDLIANSIWGKIIWYRNLGPRENPKFAAAQPVKTIGTSAKPAWNWWNPKPGELATQWRTTPFVYDFNKDGLNDLIMLDHEGYLCFYERTKQGDQLVLKQPVRLFVDAKDGKPLCLNEKEAGASGRRKICLVDYNGDGWLDLLTNCTTVDFWENVGTDSQGRIRLTNRGLVDPKVLAGHTTSPTVVDWNKDGKPELLIGAEDGRLYLLQPKP